MKIIERPESITVVDEIKFHQCQSAEEVINAFAGVREEDILVWGSTVDDAFSPWVYVVIRSGDAPLSMCLKYGYRLEHAPEFKKVES